MTADVRRIQDEQLVASHAKAPRWTTADRLRKIRRMQRLTQDAFADALSLSRGTLRRSQVANQHLHAVGLPVTLHQLRHRFATATLETSRGNLRLVQDLLGHEDPKTTAIYTKWRRSDAVAAVTALPEAA